MYYDNHYNGAQTILTKRLEFIERQYEHMLKIHLENKKMNGAVTAIVEANYYVDDFLYQKRSLQDQMYKLLPVPVKRGAEISGMLWFYMELTWRDSNTTWFFKHPYPRSQRAEHHIFGKLFDN